MTSTAIATLPVAPLPLPTPPAELAQKLATFDGMDLIRGSVSAVVVQQAKQHLALLERHHAAPRPAVIEFWCLKLRGGTAPMSDKDFAGRLSAIVDACGDLPAWVWNRNTLRAAMRTNEFFPTASKVYDLMAPIAFRGTLGLAHVRLLAAANPAPEPDGETVQTVPANDGPRRNGPAGVGTLLGVA